MFWKLPCSAEHGEPVEMTGLRDHLCLDDGAAERHLLDAVTNAVKDHLVETEPHQHSYPEMRRRFACSERRWTALLLRLGFILELNIIKFPF